MIHHIDKPESDPIIRAAMAAVDYHGRTVKLSTDIPKELNSYWQGGSRDTYTFYEPITGKTSQVASNHPFFEKSRPRDLTGLPLTILLIKHSIFCGKDVGLTIYANADVLAPMLPAPTELSELETRVLIATRSYVSSYGGIKNYRQHESGLTPTQWEAGKAACIARGFLNKAGAITAAGRNAIGNKRISYDKSRVE